MNGALQAGEQRWTRTAVWRGYSLTKGRGPLGGLLGEVHVHKRLGDPLCLQTVNL